MTTTITRARAGLAALAAVGALALTACGQESDATDSTESAAPDSRQADAAAEPAGGTEAEATTEAASLTITDPYVKAAESGMTAAFGTLVNDGDTPITVMSATTDISDAMELHETVADADGAMAMQPKDGGFVIEPGASHELSPGGDHLMVMDLTRAVEPGEDVTFTLTMADGSTTEMVATVKTVTGADEEYMSGDMGDTGADTGADTGGDTGGAGGGDESGDMETGGSDS